MKKKIAIIVSLLLLVSALFTVYVVQSAEKPKPALATQTIRSNDTLPGAREVARDGQYIKYENGVVLDTLTGLEWFAGPNMDVTWDEAKSLVASLAAAGGGWRMPTIGELSGLRQEGKGSGNMTPLLSNIGWGVWSNEKCNASSARLFPFINGNDVCYNRFSSDNYRAFAVRSHK